MGSQLVCGLRHSTTTKTAESIHHRKQIAGALLRVPRPSIRRSTPSAARAKAASNRWLLDEEDGSRELIKEEGRKYMRTLSTFTFERWASHRSTARYLRHMKGLFNSSIVRGLAQPLLSVTAVSLIVCFYEEFRSDGILPAALPTFIIPQAPFDLTSFALSLLLVFRTNSSYDRWLESVTVWSDIANRSRDTVRQLISHLYQKESGLSPLAAAMCRWVVAYCRSLKCELQEESYLETELEGILNPSEVSQMMASHHRPSFALAVLTELAARAPLIDAHRIRLDENLTFFEDAVGACERILRTPIPLSYSRHTSRFMFIWLTALPLALYPNCSWGTAPMALIISFLLLGIEEIGVQIEEPFGILPLDDLCDEIEGDVFNIVNEALVTKRLAAEAASNAMSAQQLQLMEKDQIRRRGGLFQRRVAKRGSDHREWEEAPGRLRGDDTVPSDSIWTSMDDD